MDILYIPQNREWSIPTVNGIWVKDHMLRIQLQLTVP
jgi:hypothetical protein